VSAWFKAQMLRLFRVPPEPHPPAGSPGSLRVFHAAPAYLRLQRWLWLGRQILTLGGILLGLFFFRQFLGHLPAKFAPLNLPRWFFVLEVLGLAGAVLQMPFTYAMVLLDYELRWYMVTDRSLRLRDGLASVREMTLSFANIQQITVQQGPLQRLLGLANLVVTTAGGGAATAAAHGGSGIVNWHQGVLKGVDQAEVIRDLIVERLRVLKSAGLGDPDEPPQEPAAPAAPPALPAPAPAGGAEALAAAQDLLAAARALRAELTRS
jgi:uncharacterized membrane protein YdbT with pleckstrin-like domain